MASQNGKGLSYLIIAFFLTEIALIAMVLPHSWMKSIGSQDRVYAYTWFGESFDTKTIDQATAWYKKLFISSGIEPSSYDMLINKWDAKGNVEIDDRGLAKVVKERLDTVWMAMGLAMYRLSEIFKWLLLLAPVIFGIFIDAVTQREINKWKFSAPSPSTHLASEVCIKFVFVLFIIIPIAPFPLFSPIIPLGIGLMAVSVWVLIVNMSKHI